MKAVLFISHGSGADALQQEVDLILDQLKEDMHAAIMEKAFLDTCLPDIPTGIDRCVQQGAGHILILLNFLNSGRHTGHDIPALIDQARSKYPRTLFEVSKPLALYPEMLPVYRQIIKKSFA